MREVLAGALKPSTARREVEAPAEEVGLFTQTQQPGQLLGEGWTSGLNLHSTSCQGQWIRARQTFSASGLSCK